MSMEANQLPPVVRVVTPEVPPVEIDLTHAAAGRLSTPTLEQVRAVDGVFIAHKEPDAAVSLIGLWSSALLLHDLAAETFQQPEEEDELKKELKDDKNEEQGR